MNNNKRDIPKHWKWVTLDDISVTSSGGTPDRKNSKYFKGDIPWVKSGELNYNTIVETEEYITQEALDFSSAKIFPKGSLLIALYGNTVGRMAFLGIDASTNQAIASITPFLIDPKYLYYFLMSAKEELLNRREGSAQPNISQKVLNSFPFPFAPLEEQNRIVEKIEELFSQLDKSNDELIKSKELIQNLIKKTIFNLFKKIEKRQLLKNVSNIIMGQSPNSNSYNNKGLGVPLFQGKKEFSDFFPLVEKWTTNPIRLAKEGDILMSVRAPVGDVNIANIECSIGRGLCAITFDGYYKFLFYFLDSIKQQVSDLGTGSTFSSISKDIISNILVPFPEKTKQIKLINDLEIKIANYNASLNEINIQRFKNENLKNKILQEAFKGKLLPQLNSKISIESLLKEIEKSKETYLIKQQELIKNRPKIKRMEKENLSIIQVLEKHKKPISSKQLWEDSMFSDDIEKFYTELKKVQNEIKQEKSESVTLISLI